MRRWLAGGGGQEDGEHTRATCWCAGTLVVEVEDLVWQRQLNTLRHFLLRNLREALGDQTVTEIDFRPMPRRMAPRNGRRRRDLPVEGIHDPVMGMLYRQSKKRETA